MTQININIYLHNQKQNFPNYIHESMSDEYQNVIRYTRRTYKKSYKPPAPSEAGTASPREDSTTITDIPVTPRSEGPRFDWCTKEGPSCGCNIPEAERDIASILHKKCPVISLAQQQLQRLIDGTDRLLCDNERCCRSMYDFFCICKEILMSQAQNKTQCALIILIAVAFMSGVVLGAASCGSYLGRFESPILSCIDSLFMQDALPIQESYRSVV